MRIGRAIILFSLLFIATISKAEEKADYLIISDPHKLSIFNQFEQSLTENEIKNLHLNAPFQIVKRKELLGDQITEALRCKYQGETFFLLLDDNGNLKSTSASLYQKTFQKCLILNDSVQLKQPAKIFEKYPSSGISTSCKADQFVIRIFQYSTSFYVYMPEKKIYGWINNGTSIFRTAAKKISRSVTLDITDITGLIQTRLDAANEQYRQYFEYFNTITQQNKTVPVWKMEKNGTKVHCILTSSAHIAGQLEQSTRYVVQDIEQILLGKPFTVQYSSGEIIINPR